MNLIFIIAALGVVGVAGYSAHEWAAAHALFALVGEEWHMQARGWAALWPPLTLGLLVAAVPAFALGLVASRRLAQALQADKEKVTEQAEKALSDQRQELAKKRASIDFEIQNIIKESIAAANQRAENFLLENEKNKDEILRLQRKLRIIEGQLKGAQQKAARIKARLTSV